MYKTIGDRLTQVAEEMFALTVGFLVFLFQEAPGTTDYMTLLYVFISSGGAIAVFKGIGWLYDKYVEGRSTFRARSREDLMKIIDRQDDEIKRLRKLVREEKE